jgi:hypothetical protein
MLKQIFKLLEKHVFLGLIARIDHAARRVKKPLRKDMECPKVVPAYQIL